MSPRGRQQRRVVYASVPPERVELAVRLRARWYTILEHALDEALPGAREALSYANIILADDGVLVLAMPSLYPVLRPVYPRVKQVVAETLADTVGPDIEHRVVFRGATPSLKRRAALEITDVHHPGDPDVTAWISLADDLRNALAQQNDPAVQRVLAAGTPVAFAERAVWLRFPSATALRAVGRVPGAASSLHQTLDEWNDGIMAFCFATDGT